METKHTKGPWFTKEGTGNITDSKGVRIALTVRDVSHTTTTTEMHNARLIAAAPELFEGAKQVVANWEKGDLASAVRNLARIVEQLE